MSSEFVLEERHGGTSGFLFFIGVNQLFCFLKTYGLSFLLFIWSQSAALLHQNPQPFVSFYLEVASCFASSKPTALVSFIYQEPSSCFASSNPTAFSLFIMVLKPFVKGYSFSDRPEIPASQSFVILATTFPRRTSARMLGITISPLNRSARFHTRLTLRVQPIPTKTETRIA